MKLITATFLIISFAFISFDKKPYDFDKKPIPIGRDWSKILPKKVGNYSLTNFKLYENNKCAVSGTYLYGTKKIEISATMRGDNGSACNDAMEVLRSCKNDNGTYSSGDDYVLLVCPENFYLSYKKGPNYKFWFEFFGVDKKALDEFMTTFPY